MARRWETLDKKQALDCRIFTVDSVTRKHPERDDAANFVVLNSPDWVNIIPITTEGNVVLVRQYRHGVDDLTLEIPGGLVDASEDPAQAAMRECLEETGYGSETDAVCIGKNHPNPAFLDNTCFSYVWSNCRRSATQQLDEHEDIEVVEAPIEDIPRLIAQGAIRHTLVLTAFFFYYLDQNSPDGTV